MAGKLAEALVRAGVLAADAYDIEEELGLRKDNSVNLTATLSSGGIGKISIGQKSYERWREIDGRHRIGTASALGTTSPDESWSFEPDGSKSYTAAVVGAVRNPGFVAVMPGAVLASPKAAPAVYVASVRSSSLRAIRRPISERMQSDRPRKRAADHLPASP